MKYQCLDAFNGHCSKKDCPHYNPHDEIPKTLLNKYGLVEVWACDQDVSVGSHRDCTPCITIQEAQQ